MSRTLDLFQCAKHSSLLEEKLPYKPVCRSVGLSYFQVSLPMLLLEHLLKGEFTFFFIRELDVPPFGESNLMGP